MVKVKIVRANKKISKIRKLQKYVIQNTNITKNKNSDFYKMFLNNNILIKVNYQMI